MRRLAACAVALAVAPPASAASFTLELTGPAAATYGQTITLRGRVTPALLDAPVTILRGGAAIGTAVTGADGTFAYRTRVRGPGTYAATAGELSAAPLALRVRPRLRARVVGARIVGRPLRLEARVEPRGSGTLRIKIRSDGRRTLFRRFPARALVRLAPRRATTYRIDVTVEPADGWAGAARSLRASAVEPRLSLGSRGASVRALEQRLRELHYALPRADGYYGLDTYQAVLAFQKVNGLPWTGRVDAPLWRALLRAGVPRARHPGTHIEVSKGRQYLLLVRNGSVALVIHVSTGATGNTPIGRWRVYRKVPGWDWVLWYPMYFLRGFAIHGYPSVPAYPASHGCVRVPMWIATQLYAAMQWGQTVYVYW